MRYVALLRGINVGGKNIIKMANLKTCFEKMGFSNVTTYIQSGNVLFNSEETNEQLLVQKIEEVLSGSFNYNSRIVLITRQLLAQIVIDAPEVFRANSNEYRYDVLFLRQPLSALETLSKIKTKDGVDFVTAGNGVLYFARLSSMSSQSQMTKMIGTPVYKEMTIRNWNTTCKLVEL